MDEDEDLPGEIRQALEVDGDRITDLHIWQPGPGHHGAIVSLHSADPKEPAAYRARLRHSHDLSHLTIEVEQAAITAGETSQVVQCDSSPFQTLRPCADPHRPRIHKDIAARKIAVMTRTHTEREQSGRFPPGHRFRLPRRHGFRLGHILIALYKGWR